MNRINQETKKTTKLYYQLQQSRTVIMVYALLLPPKNITQAAQYEMTERTEKNNVT